MVPNMYTVILECQREYQERLREPCPGCVAAGIHRGTPASPVRLSIVPHLAAGWRLVRQLLKAAMRQPAGRPPIAAAFSTGTMTELGTSSNTTTARLAEKRPGTT